MAAAARVLILDDEPSILALLAELLDLLGYSCATCQSPADALRTLRSESFDVVLSDFRMPQMNGEQFYAAAISARPELKEKIIFLTGDTLSDDTQIFLKRTGARHLNKPFDLESVQQTISEVISGAARI
jgi:CheY-like chemotaxis protein